MLPGGTPIYVKMRPNLGRIYYRLFFRNRSLQKNGFAPHSQYSRAQPLGECKNGGNRKNAIPTKFLFRGY